MAAPSAEPEALGGAAQQPARESTRRPVASPLPPGGSSNSRSRCSRVAGPPPSARNRLKRAVLDAVSDGRVPPAEAERLAGFVSLPPECFSERTRQRRWRRLRELGVVELTAVEQQVAEITDLVDRGELSYLEAELRVGRFFLAQLALGRVDEPA